MSDDATDEHRTGGIEAQKWRHYTLAVEGEVARGKALETLRRTMPMRRGLPNYISAHHPAQGTAAVSQAR